MAGRVASVDPFRRAWMTARAAFSRESTGWIAISIALVALIALPLVTIVVLALRPGGLGTAMSPVLGRALWDTLVLMAATGGVTLVVGTGTAWLVTMYRFPLRGLLDRLLVLPLAMPAYILAFAYVELLDYAGPVQRGVRSLFGLTSRQQYMFPEIRSLTGAVFLMSCALFPYVYLSARASFVQQSVCVLEVARTLGRTSLGAFWSVALPLARPALVAGVALVLMECVNEFGAMQHIGVDTLTVAVYTTWLQRGSLPGAAQIAVAALVLVALILGLERSARAGAKFHNTTGRHQSLPFQDLYGVKAIAAVAACLLPVLLGFVVPFLVLAYHATRYANEALDSGFLGAVARSVLLATLAAVIAVIVGLVLAYARRIVHARVVAYAAFIAGLGYALPGTVLALGLKLPLSAFDTGVDVIMRSWTGLSSGLLISGSIVIVLLAHVIRFLAVAMGAIDAGLERLSPNLDAAARTLGETATSALRRVHLPLILPALWTAALLVFVDAMKELPATLLLRPFNFETLATHVYALAALEKFEAAGLGALAIVLVGLLPVLLLHRAIATGRAGG